MIETANQFEAGMALGRLLRKLEMPRGKFLALRIAREYGHEFEICSGCDLPRFQCTCRDEDDYRGYDQYSDEASFE